MKFCRGLLPLFFLSWVAASFPARAALSPELNVYWIDVEGGAATLLVTPSGESVLIDTGMPGGRDAARIHHVATQVAGVGRINHLIVTHFHLDHFGGAAELARMMTIENLYDNGIPASDPDGNPDSARFLNNIAPYRELAVSRRRVMEPGETLDWKSVGDQPPLRLTCLAARQKLADGRPTANLFCEQSTPKPPDRSDNANSIVALIRYGDFDLFAGGDLTWSTEAALVCPKNRVGTVDVYQVDHHGLDVSNNPVLVWALAPAIAVMSNGPVKGCGTETFRTLKNTPHIQAIYQMHRNIRAGADQNTAPELIANSEENCAANYIRLTVAPDSKTYTVLIPGTGHTRTFQTR